MQIIPSAWAAITAHHHIPDSPHRSPYSPHDATWAASFLLCDNQAGDPAQLRAAIFSYIHADWYVTQVLAQARRYREQIPDQQAVSPRDTPPGPPAGNTQPRAAPDAANSTSGSAAAAAVAGLDLAPRPRRVHPPRYPFTSGLNR